jgi:hypothetical protein
MIDCALEATDIASCVSIGWLCGAKRISPMPMPAKKTAMIVKPIFAPFCGVGC